MSALSETLADRIVFLTILGFIKWRRIEGSVPKNIFEAEIGDKIMQVWEVEAIKPPEYFGDNAVYFAYGKRNNLIHFLQELQLENGTLSPAGILLEVARKSLQSLSETEKDLSERLRLLLMSVQIS